MRKPHHLAAIVNSVSENDLAGLSLDDLLVLLEGLGRHARNPTVNAARQRARDHHLAQRRLRRTRGRWKPGTCIKRADHRSVRTIQRDGAVLLPMFSPRYFDDLGCGEETTQQYASRIGRTRACEGYAHAKPHPPSRT
jgi:hypothetical protein